MAQNARENAQADAGNDYVYGESVSDDEEPFTHPPTFDPAGNYVHHGREEAEDPTVPIREAGRSVFEAEEPFSEEMATSTLKVLEEGVVEVVPVVSAVIAGIYGGGGLLSRALPYVFRGLNWTTRSILVALEWTLLQALWLINWLAYIATILSLVVLIIVGLTIAFYHVTIKEKRNALFLRLFGTATPSLADTTPALLLDLALCLASASLFYFLPFRYALPLGMIWPTICVAGLCGYSVLVAIDRMAIGWMTLRRDAMQEALTAREQRAGKVL